MQSSAALRYSEPARPFGLGAAAVLVVDPDASFGIAVRDALRPLGHTVIVRTSTRDLLDAIRALEPQVIVLDPESCAMKQTARFVRQHFPHIYIVAYTNKPEAYLRPQLTFDITLRRGPLPVFASQFQCWARHV